MFVCNVCVEGIVLFNRICLVVFEGNPRGRVYSVKTFDVCVPVVALLLVLLTIVVI